MTRSSHLAVFIFIFSLVVYAVIKWKTSDVENENVLTGQETPDFIAEQLQTKIYNDQGKLSHIVQAQRMEHYSILALTSFEFPNYIIHPKNETPPWQVTADEATLYGNNRLVLKNRVVLKATDKNSLIQEVHCKYLELDLNSNIISSDQTVLIQGASFTMYGSGLIIDLNSTQMTLTEHVQTKYKKFDI